MKSTSMKNSLLLLTLSIAAFYSQIDAANGKSVEKGIKNSFSCVESSETGSITCSMNKQVDFNDKFLSSINNESMQLVTTSTTDDWTKDLPLTWYTVGLVCVFILQMLICIGMYCWIQSKLKKMKKEQERQSDEFYKFLYSFNKMMKLEEEQMNIVMQQQNGYDGRTPK